MRYSKLILLPAILLVLLTGLFLRVGRPNIAHAAPTVSCGQWSVINSPNLNTYNYLYGVAAISSNDAWAVGVASYINNQTLTEHWNGTKWSVVPSPNPNGGSLTGVTALSSKNVWAVGSYNPTSGGVQYAALIEHWNGTAWSIIPSPSPGSYYSYLNGIAAISANNIWAVGVYADSINSPLTLTEHWNGTTWSVVPAPGPGLIGATATPDGTVWAVGSIAANPRQSDTLIEKWNGTQWSIVPSPNVPQASENTLGSITAISDDDIWAAGYSYSTAYATLIEHWNGTQWSIVPSPNPSSGNEIFLVGLAAISANNVWAVGDTDANGSPFIEHWNGAQGSIALGPGSTSADLSAITNVPGTSDLWAVGYLAHGSRATTLTMFYC